MKLDNTLDKPLIRSIIIHNNELKCFGSYHKVVDVAVLKHRKTEKYFSLKLNWKDNNNWELSIDFNLIDLNNGTWDLYMKEPNHNERIHLQTDALDNSEYTLFSTRNEITRKIEMYKTIYGNASLKVVSPKIHINDYSLDFTSESTILFNSIVEFPSEINMDGFMNHLLLIRNKDNKAIDCPVNLIETNPDRNEYSLSFSFDYKNLVEFYKKTGSKKFSVYLLFEINNQKYIVRLSTSDKSLKQLSSYEHTSNGLKIMFLYSTIKDNLAINLEGVSVSKNISFYSLNHKGLTLHGVCNLDNIPLQNKHFLQRFLIIKERDTLNELEYDLGSEESFEITVPLKELYNLTNNRECVLDIYVQFSYNDHLIRKRIGCEEFNYSKDGIIDKVNYKKMSGVTSYYLTFTPRGYLKILKASHSWLAYLYMMYGQYLDYYFSQKNIWLIGERGNTAQDTGFHFFNYCREHYPNSPIYYVIDKNSRDFKNLMYMDNVIIKGSYQHYRLAAKANVFIGSHDIDYILPDKGINFYSYKKRNKVFLQHGVLGRKNVEYHKKYYEYPFNLFLVSSKYEKDMVQQTLGYSKKEVAVTGLSRFDHLKMQHSKKQTSIIVIPTWRDWLGNDDDFKKSNYFNKYYELLTNNELNTIIQRNNIKLYFYPHYRMQAMIHHFKDIDNENISIVELGQRNVQDLLIESDLMITDYSSVSFDFNYMSKPVIFYHFDRNKFFSKGILRPIEETFLGDICVTPEQIVDNVKYYIQYNFKEKQNYVDKKHLIFDHVDTNNAKRIFDEINRL
ncbi:hypothetical protein Pryu01_00841 [Paraliobacillus ryukyuensis]|uniref:CDP-glycerol glycerophosphotransferase (TagB/SpsB family) n=1 Tax=Paraliobacillus ryukyuensis TaxID=200904 RepID=A0A366EEY9_9BACI|nr:CDP-glycerol glycerophosphotransferase family protein [Paraliobacillus ryukyuensis]RBP00586.1 CDP-glycerol glycerophosphotransferase (TagB/SpsB family) [Paraliobacillus ryukyuensis]